MADFKQNNKDAKEYYETQQKIAEVIKRQTADWKTFGDAQKAVAKNAKLIKEQSKEIAKLEKEGSAAAIAKAEALKKERKYLVDLNKEMLKTSTLAKGIGKSIGGWGLEKVLGAGTDIISMFNNMDKATRRTSMSIGLSINRMNTFKTIAAESAHDLVGIGLETAAAGEMMGALSEETGRQTMMTKDGVVAMGTLSQRIGISHQEMAGLAGQMENFGLGAEDSVELVSGIADTADKMGVNTQKVIKKVQQNLKLINKLSFKGGVKGMAEMAAYSEKYKISMEEVAGFAEKVFRPEGAIDAAANLQVLGGGLAKLGDPFQLMYQARNSPKELAKSIVEATNAVAVFNDKTGEFEVSGYQLDRMREASDATGLSMDMLVGVAKQAARVDMFEGMIGKGVGKDEKEFLSTIATMRNGKAMVIDMKGNYKELSEISNDEAKRLMEKKKSDKEAAEAAMTTMDRLEAIWNQALASLLPHMDAFEQVVRGPLLGFATMLKDIFMWFTKNPMIAKLVLGLITIGPVLGKILSPIAWYLKGRMLSKGFDHGQKKSGWIKSLTAKMKGWFGMGKGAAQQKMYKGGQFMPGGGRAPKGGAMGAMGGAGKGAAGTKAMGQSAGGQSKNFLKGAVALLAISAALFIFAKALQEFEKLQNGWATLLLAAGSLIVLGAALAFIRPVLEKFGAGGTWVGIAAMVALAASVTALGFATTLFAQGGVAGTALMIVSLLALAFAVTMFGGLSLSGVGWAGVALILALGAAMIMMGYSVKLMAEGIAIIVNSFTSMFEVVSMDNIGSLLLLGPAFIGIGLGLFVLTGALIGFGLAWLLGGWAFEDMAESITAMGDVDLSGLGTAVQAINDVDMNKLEAIRDLAASLSMVSMFSGGGFKIDMGDLEVKGKIELKGKGGSDSTDWVEDPIFVSKLKDIVWEAMDADRNGGKN